MAASSFFSPSFSPNMAALLFILCLLFLLGLRSGLRPAKVVAGLRPVGLR
jgi:hypothetical protein